MMKGDPMGFHIKPRMTVDRIFTDSAWHPPRRRVKFFPATKTVDTQGNQVMVDNSDFRGDYPILWSRRIGDGERRIILLIDDDAGLTAHATIAEADFEKLPETEVEW